MSDEQDATDTVELLAILEAKGLKLHTQSLDLSFNELLDMYKTNELDISPEYQRLFQWSEGARSRFIESLLLEMPVPPIYVIEEADGRYTLIDGLQRLSSYLHLRGELAAPDLEPPVELKEQLTLVDCDIVPELNGKTYADLGTALQIRLKRSFVRVEVVRKGSDPHFKYHMFKRLNTGGMLLSDQQLRNCTIRLLSPQFNDFIQRLSKKDHFRKCTESLTPQNCQKAIDQELVLRFFALKNNRQGFKHDVRDFLTEYMETVSDPSKPSSFDYEAEEDVFNRTFALFAETLGPRSFCYANNRRRGNITRGFSVYHFEAFTLGVQPYLGSIGDLGKTEVKAIKDVFVNIKLNEEFRRITTGGGKNSPGPLAERIQFVTDELGKNYEPK